MVSLSFLAQHLSTGVSEFIEALKLKLKCTNWPRTLSLFNDYAKLHHHGCLNNSELWYALKTSQMLMAVVAWNSYLSYFSRQTGQTLIRQLLQELADLGQLCFAFDYVKKFTN